MERLQKSIAPGAIVKVKIPLFRKLQFTVVSVAGSTAVVRHPKTGDRIFPLNKLVLGYTHMPEPASGESVPPELPHQSLPLEDGAIVSGHWNRKLKALARAALRMDKGKKGDQTELTKSRAETIDYPSSTRNIDEIEARINEIRSQGPVPPFGVWVETCAVKNGFRQAYWRSRSPCFISKRSGGNPEARLKRQYIGKQNSAAHKEAMRAIARRNEIKKLEKSKNGR
jgi:hypothetical protein